MFDVVEYKNRKRIVIATEFRTKADAQQHVANIDPAARRDLHVEEK